MSNSRQRVAVFETSLGWMALALHAGAVRALSFGRRSPREAVDALGFDPPVDVVDSPSTAEQALIERLTAFADGRPDDFLDVEIELGQLTKFTRKVLTQCRRIPPGKTLTYAQLAAKAGSARAARAVGNVMATNRLPLLVPCHRVVGSGGLLGGYSAPDGLRMKRRLLDREGVKLK
jgi:methylated-DNA-[protein]-cysteine S-methyltransferase